MFRRNAAALSLMLCLAAALNMPRFSGAQAPAAPPSPKARAGQEIFTQKCVQCHALHQGQYSFGPNMEGEMTKPHHKSAAEIRAVIKEGKGKMPGFADKLAPPEIDDLLVYIRTL
jgi:mono/diheme cytochrome c family protein